MHDRPGWLGPLFFWDLLTQGRQRHLHIYRLIYAALLLVMLYFTLGREELRVTLAAYYAGEAMRWVLILQFLAVVVLTPVFVAGIVIVERRRGTLTLLLTTFLTTREIVVGKLAARLLSVVSVLLAGVPVIAILQLMGGVDFVLTVLWTLHTFFIMTLLGMHALHASLSCKTTAAAILKAYALFLVNLLFGYSVVIPFAWIMTLITDYPFWIVQLVLLHIYYFLLASLALAKTLQIVGRRDLDAETERAMEEAAYESPVQEWKSLARALRLTKDKYGPIDRRYLVNSPFAQGEPGLIAARYYRIPYVWNRCLLWKDMYLPTSRAGYMLTTAGCLVLGLALFLITLAMPTGSLPRHQEYNVAYRVLAAFVMLLPLIIVGLRASACLAEEHEQRTLSSLFSTPLTTVHILREKWLGCFFRYRLLMPVTALLLILFTLSLPLQAWLVLPLYVGQLIFFTTLGLYLSARLGQPHRARMAYAVVMLLCLFVFPIVHRVAIWDTSFTTIPRGGLLRIVQQPDGAVWRQTLLTVACPVEAWSLWQRNFHDTIWVEHPGRPLLASWMSTIITLITLSLLLFALTLRRLRRLKEMSA